MITVKENTRTAWLGNFPTHWKVLRIKNLFQEIDERSETGEEDLLSVSHYTGVTLKRENLENENDYLTNAETLEGYKRVKQGDLVINIMLAWNGSLGISPFDGITSPAYCVYRIKGNDNPEYFGYLFSTSLFKAEFRKYSTGIIDSRLRLYSDKFFSIYSFVPSKDEQDEIVRYIKAQEEKINHFIQKKQHLIELLKEQRQSIINEAVTKGIDPNVKMKSSGIEWLGDIPMHWKIHRLKNCASYKSGENITSEDIEIEGEYPVYGGNGLRGFFSQYTHDGEYVLIGRQGALCGNINYAQGKFWASEHAIITTINKGIDLFWFGETLRVMNLNQYSQSAAQPGISVERIRALHLPVPSIEEQQQIVEYIKTETATIDIAIAKAEKEIELIKEYKEAMIAEAVTGKLQIKNKNVQPVAQKREANWEFKEAILISVLTDKFGSTQYPLGRKRYTKFSYLFHRHTDNKTEGYLHKAAGPYNPKTKYAGPEKIALQNKYVEGSVNGNYSGFVAGDEIQNAKNYFEKYWNAEALNWLEQFRKKTNDELELYTTVDKAMLELAENKKGISLQTVKQVIDEHPEWKPKLERDIFSDKNISGAIEFLKQLFV